MKKSRGLLCAAAVLVMVLAATALAACGSDETEALAPASPSSDVVAAAAGSDELTQFSDAVVAAGMDTTLAAEGPFTVFAASDDAVTAAGATLDGDAVQAAVIEGEAFSRATWKRARRMTRCWPTTPSSRTPALTLPVREQPQGRPRAPHGRQRRGLRDRRRDPAEGVTDTQPCATGGGAAKQPAPALCVSSRGGTPQADGPRYGLPRVVASGGLAGGRRQRSGTRGSQGRRSRRRPPPAGPRRRRRRGEQG